VYATRFFACLVVSLRVHSSSLACWFGGCTSGELRKGKKGKNEIHVESKILLFYLLTVHFSFLCRGKLPMVEQAHPIIPSHPIHPRVFVVDCCEHRTSSNLTHFSVCIHLNLVARGCRRSQLSKSHCQNSVFEVGVAAGLVCVGRETD
jgi:hypothetical protein